MNIYSDLDDVLHSYGEGMCVALEKLYGIDIDSKEQHLTYTVTEYLRRHRDFTEKMITKVVKEADTYTEWVPTPFAKDVVNFLTRMHHDGHSVMILSARRARYGAEEIIKQMFPHFEVPFVTCDKKFKKNVVRSDGGAIFIEDLAETANACAKLHSDTLVIVPKWPWNEEKLENLPNLLLLEHEEFENLEEKIKEIKEKCLALTHIC